MVSEDNFEDFIGQELINISIIDEDLVAHEKIFGHKKRDNDEAEGAVFVNLTTPLGVIQFAVYNSHNGYYSHYVKVFEVLPKEKLLKEDCI